MWFALLLLLIAFWIGGLVSLIVVVGLVARAVGPEIGWAVGALLALACIASLAGWLDRPREWLLERADRFAPD